jgi:hypothetical protein
MAWSLAIRRLEIDATGIYPAMFEITRCDSRTAIEKARRLGRTQKMTCLDWKSDAVATVIHP